MNYEQLKNSILQEAIEGRLVPQDPSDEPAAVLLQRIREEKARLVKEKKIKKDKNESIIYRNADGHWMERFEDKKRGEVCIDEEIPFEIPESWEWTRIGNVFDHNTGKALNGGKGPGKSMTYITTSNLYWNRFDLDNLKSMNFTDTEVDKCTVRKGDLLVCEGGDYGRAAIWNYDFDIRIQNHIHRLRPFLPLSIKYIYYIFNLYKSIGVIAGKGIAIQGLSSGALHRILFPLPPLSEQHRIVSRIEEIMPKVEEYGKAQERLDALNAKLPKDLKNSILQEAIEGRLVPQDPSDEPATVLLRRIREEKARLVKEKKIKKDKNASIIYRNADGHWMERFEDKKRGEVCIDEEVPFEIPEGWEWCRLSEITFNHGQKKPDVKFSYIDIGSINNKRQKLNKEENLLAPEKAPSRARKIVKEGDIIYSTVRPYLHNMAIIDKDFSCEPIASTGFAVLACINGIFNKYLFYYLMSPSFDQYANDGNNAKGIAYPAINDEKLYKALVPLPPLSEQHRIVSQLERLLPKVSRLTP